LTIATLKDASKLNLGAGNALVIAPGDSANFISPAGTPIEMMLKRVDLSVSMMIRTFANMLTNGTTQSGEAKVIDRQVGALQLKNVANYLEQIEYKIYEVFQCFIGNDVATTGYDYTVEYYKDFDLTDIAGYIAQAIEVTNMGISDEAKMEVRKSVLRKFMSGEDKEKIEELMEVEGKNKEPMAVEGLDTVTEEDNQDAKTIDTTTTNEVALPVAPSAPISNTALNGAQVTSLLDILAQVSSSVIPKESAKATIQFAFPGVDATLVDSMLNSIVPKAPVA
jgi:predicted Zn-dependent peptidase